MTSKVESIVKEMFSLVGMDIRWTPVIIDNPTSFNTSEAYDEFFSIGKNVKNYLGHGRLLFYEECVNILTNADIKLHEKKIADVGCGTGHLLKILSKQANGSDLHGLDHSDQALRITRNTVPGVEVHTTDIYNLPSIVFDIVLCTEVLEHLLNPTAALHQLIGIVEKNGMLFITVPDGRIDVFRGHINFWSPESWNAFIKTTLPPELEYRVGSMSGGCNYAIIWK